MRSRWTICPVQKSEMKYDHQMIQKISSAKIQLDSLEKAACPGYHLLQTPGMPLLLNCIKYPVSKNTTRFFPAIVRTKASAYSWRACATQKGVHGRL